MKNILKRISKKNIIIVFLVGIIIIMGIIMISIIKKNNPNQIIEDNIKDNMEIDKVTTKTTEMQSVKTTKKTVDKKTSTTTSTTTQKIIKTPSKKETTKVIETNTTTQKETTKYNYICPSGYSLNSDKSKCVKVIELVDRYKCSDNYILNDDNTCSGIVTKPAVDNYSCPSAMAGGWRFDSTDKNCYYENGTGLREFTKEKCIERNLVFSDGLNCCYIKKEPAFSYYSCSNGWTKTDDNMCIKTETLKATKYKGCPEDYKLSNNGDSCVKEITPTKQ